MKMKYDEVMAGLRGYLAGHPDDADVRAEIDKLSTPVGVWDYQQDVIERLQRQLDDVLPELHDRLTVTEWRRIAKDIGLDLPDR